MLAKPITKISYNVAVYLYGDDLDSDLISEILQLAPTKERKKGSARTSAITGRTSTSPTGLWMTKSPSKSEMLAEHIDALISRLKSAPRLTSLPGVTMARLDIIVLWGSSNPAGLKATSNFKLDPKQLEEIVRLGLEVCITVDAFHDSNLLETPTD
ncbi:MAG: DUF4279 domain-containing protein [Hyphomicrobium sp.]